MRTLAILVAAMSLTWPCFQLTRNRQQKTFQSGSENDVRAIKGMASPVQLSAIPAHMRFRLIKPSAKFGLKQLSYEWWKFPKTKRRPPFAVAAISYRDPKFSDARILVVEWKYIEDVSTGVKSFAAREALRPDVRLGSDNLIPVIGTKQGTEVAFFSVSLPIARVREMTEWVPSDVMTPNWASANESTPNTRRQQSAGMANRSLDKLRSLANSNARALATAVEARAITDGKYDAKLEDYATDLGGSIPVNPCTGTVSGYTITTATTMTATVSANAGTKCGTWKPMVFSLTL